MADLSEFVSGETFFRSKSSTCCNLGLDPKFKPLNDFLESDSSRSHQKSQSRITLERLKSIRHLNSTFYDLSVAHDAIIIQQYLDSTCKCALNEAISSGQKITEETRQLQESNDSKFMERALEYFAILKEEMNSTRSSLNVSSIECNHKKQQAKRLRDMQIYSRHLSIETQGAVSFEAIPIGSPQWKRCRKAVKDNLNMSRLRSAGCRDVKVLNAFKLEHRLLSRHMQLSRSSGAYEEDSQPQILPGLFQLPWFCAELSGSSEPIRVGDRGGPRESKATDTWTGHTTHGPDGRVRAKPQGAAEILAQANSCLKLRFSKYSNCRTKCDDSQHQQENEEGTFMTLCRVLIDRVQTTEEDVGLEDMRAAKASGHDAIYSRSRDEYVLLKPEYVIPEFLMHVKMVSDDVAEQPTDNGEHASGLTTHTTGGSSKHFSNLSRKISTSKIIVPSTLTLAPPSYLSGGEYDGDAPFDRNNVRICGPGSGSLYSENDGIGKLLMRNKIGISKEEREISGTETLKSMNIGKGNSGLGLGPSRIEHSGAEECVPSVSEEEEGRSKVSTDNHHLHLQAMKRKQSITSALHNTQQDWRYERRRIVAGVCRHLQSQHTPSPSKDRTLDPDRNSG